MHITIVMKLLKLVYCFFIQHVGSYRWKSHLRSCDVYKHLIVSGAAHIVDGEMKDWSRIREQKQMMN